MCVYNPIGIIESLLVAFLAGERHDCGTALNEATTIMGHRA